MCLSQVDHVLSQIDHVFKPRLCQVPICLNQFQGKSGSDAGTGGEGPEGQILLGVSVVS